MSDDGTNKNWLVGNPSRTAQVAALWVGSAALLILGLQPVLLGALLADGRVNFDQLAMAATAEILAIGIGSVVAAFAINSRYLRIKAAILLLMTAFFNVLTASAASPETIILWRGLAGCVEGGLVAFSVELIARSRYAGLYGGYFVTMQTVAQSIIAAFLAFFVIGNSGSAGGFLLLAAVCGISAVAAFWMPSEYGTLPKPEDVSNSGLFRAPPIIALLSVFFYYMFLGSIWAFLEPLAGEAGISARTAGFMVSMNLAAQVVGASTATAIESRLRYAPVLAGCALLAAFIAAALALHPGIGLFWVLALITGFICLFVLPFQVRLTIAADSTRKAALLVPAAQLIGSALGPAFGSFFISGTSVAPVSWFACGAALTSAFFILVFVLVQRKVSGGFSHAA